MKKAGLIICAVVLPLCLAGCSGISNKGAHDLQTQLNGFKKKTQVRISKNQLALQKLEEENRIQKKQLTHLAQENERLSRENQVLAERVQRLEEKVHTARPIKQNLPELKGSLKIKVLSGDCNPRSAERMVRRLERMGYDTISVGLANRCNFEYNTVFFAPDAADSAKRLAADLGENTVHKAIAWDTAFDLVVVTGLSGQD